MKDCKVLVFALVAFLSIQSSYGQTFTSTKDGVWDDPTVWSLGSVPNNGNSTRININHKITVTAAAFPVGGDLIIDQTTIGNTAAADLIIDAGAGVILSNGAGIDLTFSGASGKVDVSGRFAANTGTTFTVGYSATQFNFLAGSTYEHKAASPSTALPTATYDATSTVLIDGYTGGGTYTAAWNVPLGNVVYNCPNQAAGIANFAGFLRNVQGDFTVLNTGTTGRIYFNSTGNSTAASSSAINIAGNFSVSGVSRVFMTTTGNVEVYVAKDFTFNSSSSSANNSGSAAGAGTGLLQVGGTATLSGSSSWNFSSGTNGSGTLKLLGDLSCGILLTETGTGTSQGNLTFAGSSGQQNFDPNGATIANTVNVTVNNAAGVNLATDFTLTGGLILTNGPLSLPGISLTLSGPVSQVSGSIATTANSTLIVAGAGTLPANLTFGAGSTFDTFEMNRSATTLTTNSSFTVTNLLLYAGTLANTAGAITMGGGGLVDLHATSAANTGVLSNSLSGTYDLQYTNNVALSTGAELPLSTTALNTLTKLGTNTLTVTKNITINGDLIVSAGTISDGGVARTINLLGNYTSTGTASTWSTSGTTFNFSGPSLSTFSGTIAPAFNTLNFSNDVSISTGFSVNGNLTVASGKTVTASAGTCTFGGTTALTNNGTLNLFAVTIPNGGTLNHASGTFGVAGTFNINGTGILNSLGTVLFNGNTSLTGTSANKVFKNITVNSGSTFGGAVNWILTGTLDNSGTVNFTAGSLTINGTTIFQNTGTFTFNGISITAGQSLTANSDFTIGGSLAANGSFSSTKKVTVTGANTMTGAATKSFTDLTINSGGSLTPNSAYTIKGNVIVNGTLNAGNNTTTFGGTTAFSGSGSATLYNVVISASSALNASMPITVTGTGTFTNNNVFSNSALTTFARAGVTTLSGGGTASFGALTINSGTTLTPNQAYSVGGNLTVNGTLNAGSATFNGTTTISGAPVSITFTNLTVSGSLTSYTGNITVNGNFTNNGVFTGNGGTVTFSALAAGTHTVSGTSAATFSNISVLGGAAATDVTLASNQNLAGVITLAANAVVSSGGFLTLLSTGDSPTADASVATLPAGASITGNVTVQRYMTIEGANSTRIYRYISSPVQSATIADFQNEIPVTGSFTGTSVCSGCTTSASMFWYDETAAGSLSNGYVAYPTTSNSQTFVTGRGYTAFVRGNLLSGSAKFDLHGPINSGLINYGVTYTSTAGGPSNDGWNLIGNPYPSTIDWNSGAGWTKTNVGGTIYMTDNGSNPSKVATWNGSVGTNGGSRYISSSQAFFIQTTGASPVLTSTESVKTAGTQTTFIRAASPSNILRITLSQGNVQDETVIHFRDSTTTNFDFKFDAVKLKNLKNDNSATPFLNLSSIATDNSKLAINSLPFTTSQCSTIIPLDVSDVPVGTYSLNFSSMTTFDSFLAMQLKDNFTSSVVDIKQQPNYSFQVTAAALSYGANRFVVTISYPQAPSQLALKTADVCKGTPATVTVSNSATGLNYFVKLSGNQIGGIQSGTGSDLNFTILKDSLKVGVDTVEVWAKSQYCSSSYSQKVALNVQDVYNVASASSTSVCQSGTVTLSASGAPLNGSYRWYSNQTDTVAIAGQSASTFTTLQLSKPRTFYVAAVNGLGCEGARTPVLANVINYNTASITLLNDLKTLQSNYTTGNQWNVDGQPIPGATASIYTPTKEGNYSVTVSTQGCSTTSEPVNYVITAVENEPAQGNFVYPNPTSGSVTIQAKLTSESLAQIFDGQGKQVGGTKMVNAVGDLYKGTYDFGNHPAGIYLVRIADGNNWITLKVIRK
jgi:hypothetical protein